MVLTRWHSALSCVFSSSRASVSSRACAPRCGGEAARRLVLVAAVFQKLARLTSRHWDPPDRPGTRPHGMKKLQRLEHQPLSPGRREKPNSCDGPATVTFCTTVTRSPDSNSESRSEKVFHAEPMVCTTLRWRERDSNFRSRAHKMGCLVARIVG